jgi:hypothetical protein
MVAMPASTLNSRFYCPYSRKRHGMGCRPRRNLRTARTVRVERRACAWSVSFMVTLLNQQRFPFGRFVPEPCPSAIVEKIKRKVIHKTPFAA